MEKTNKRALARPGTDARKPKGNGVEDVMRTQAVRIAEQHPIPRRESGWLCAEQGVAPDTFDPTDVETLNEARSWCLACPLRATCLRMGTELGAWGVWGGVLLEAGRPGVLRGPGRPSQKSRDAMAAARAENEALLA